MLFKVHAKLHKRDTFTFEEFSLEQSVWPANKDFTAVADDAMPRNPFSGRSGGHGATSRARTARQTKSFGQPSVR